MKDGYIRVASASIDTLIGNVKHNANEIKKVLKETREKKAQVVVFPELVLSGYTLEDLFLQNRLLNECLVQLEEIMKDTKGHQQIVVIGLPFHYQNNLYNVSAVLYDGSILGIVPKYHIPNYNEYYEGRRFTPCFEDNIEIELFGQIVLFGRKVVFACQNLPSFTLGVEICEDLWLPNAPSNELALNGATVICNTSASNELTAKKDYRRNLVSMQSAKLVSGYVYSNAGSGESTTDVVFSGHHLICENGTIINESTGFDAEVIYGDLDVEKLVSERRKMTTYQSHHDYDYVYFDMDLIDIETNHYYDPHPFVPSNPKLRELRCKEVFEIQTRGLMQRLKATHINKVVIGISGGLDSTLALLVCVMAFEKLGYDTQIKLLNASDFGVPQLRPRVVIVGIRKEENKYFMYPEGNPQMAPTVGNALYDLMAENKWKGAKKWAQNANKIAPTLVGGSKKHGGPDLGPVRARNAWAELGVDGRGVANMAPEPDFEGMPRLTSRMLARIQGFPDTWTFGKKKTAACRMIGNAFPPPVAKAVGEKIKECLENECTDCERTISLSRKIV